MGILNYTTTIDAEKSSFEIHKKLVKAKAQAIINEYDDGIMCAISFRINTQYGLLSFRLPAQIKNIYHVLNTDSSVPRKLRTREQATRVAWRILKDWIGAQLAIVEAGLAELPEVFLPYAQAPNGQTLFHALKEKGFKQLTSGSDHE